MSLFFDWNCINASLEKCILSILCKFCTGGMRETKYSLTKDQWKKFKNLKDLFLFCWELTFSSANIVVIEKTMTNEKMFCCTPLQVALMLPRRIFLFRLHLYLFGKWNQTESTIKWTFRAEKEKNPICINSNWKYM